MLKLLPSFPHLPSQAQAPSLKKSSKLTTQAFYQYQVMPLSRELASKKSDSKDRHSRGPAGSGVTSAKKGGAGAHNWGVSSAEEQGELAVDRNDPNYDSSDEKNH